MSEMSPKEVLEHLEKHGDKLEMDMFNHILRELDDLKERVKVLESANSGLQFRIEDMAQRSGLV